MSLTDVLERPAAQLPPAPTGDDAGRKNSLPLLVVAIAVLAVLIALVLAIASMTAPAGASQSSGCGSAPGANSPGATAAAC
jgi:hypothetical protein